MLNCLRYDGKLIWFYFIFKEQTWSCSQNYYVYRLYEHYLINIELFCCYGFGVADCYNVGSVVKEDIHNSYYDFVFFLFYSFALCGCHFKIFYRLLLLMLFHTNFLFYYFGHNKRNCRRIFNIYWLWHEHF